MNIVSAQRVPLPALPLPSSLAAKNGLRYERAVARGLARSGGCLVIHNPAFCYTTDEFIATATRGPCIPDILLTSLDFLPPAEVVVLEVKQTYTPTAAEKLLSVYVPVVRRALCAAAVWPVVVCKNLNRSAPAPHFTLKTALLGRLVGEISRCPKVPTSAPFVPVVQWLGKGEFPIGA